MTDILNLISVKQYRLAHEKCLSMIREDANDPRAYHGLGIIALEHNNYAKAHELLERAAQLGPKVAAYWAALAQFYSLVGQQEEARQAAEEASALSIEDSLTADIVGVVFSRAGFHERAVPFFEQAIRINPDPANYHYNLASSLQFSGDFTGAKKAYENVISRDRAFHKAYSGLTSLEKQTSENNRLEELKALFLKYQDDANARLNFGHSIAKTYEDLGEYETSLQWLKEAKVLNHKKFPVDAKKQRDLFEAAKVTASSVKTVEAPSCDAEPIFVVGLPRTGTTLVDRILSSHRDVVAMGELNVFASLVKMKSHTSNNLILDGDILRAAASADFCDVGPRYIESTKALARGAPRFTDKMPLNFFYAGLILRAMPNARIVALRRGAMDSCLSNYRQLFSTQFSYYNYTYGLESTAVFYREFDTLMAYYRTALPDDRFMEVRYEDIVFDQENQTRRLLEFCNLDWDEACLRFHENDMPVSTASSVQVRQPLYSGSIGRWKRYGDSLEPLKEKLGDLA